MNIFASEVAQFAFSFIAFMAALLIFLLGMGLVGYAVRGRSPERYRVGPRFYYRRRC